MIFCESVLQKLKEFFLTNRQRHYCLVRVGAYSYTPLPCNLQQMEFPEFFILKLHQSTTLFMQQLAKLFLLKGNVI